MYHQWKQPAPGFKEKIAGHQQQDLGNDLFI